MKRLAVTLGLSLSLAACGGTAAPTPSGSSVTSTSASGAGAIQNPASASVAPSGSASGASANSAPAAASAAGGASPSAGASGVQAQGNAFTLAAATPVNPSAYATAAPVMTAAAATRQPLNPPVKVRLGVTKGTVEAQIHYADAKGFFKAEGLDVELDFVPVPATAITQLAGNNLDAAGSAPDTSLYNAINRGVDMKVVSYMAIGAPEAKGLAVVVRKDLIDSGRYKEPKDLKGMTVALSAPQGSSGFWMQEILSSAGLTLKDVNIQTLAFTDMPAALTNKAVDVAMLTQPGVLNMENQNVARTIYVAGQLNYGGPSELLLLSSGFAKNQPEAAKRLVLAFVRAQRELFNIFQNGAGGQAARDEVYDMETKYTPITDLNLVKILTSISGAFNGIPINGEMPVARMQAYQDFFIQSGSQQTPIDVSKLIDSSYVNYAVQQLGGPLPNPNLPQPPANGLNAPKPEPLGGPSGPATASSRASG
ncbi:MAG: ABC transporter substrate-binding protein [Chloroflexi bacterium]|nr:ABC transporter substrate-binding protein [Chloroflexota bacterium]